MRKSKCFSPSALNLAYNRHNEYTEIVKVYSKYDILQFPQHVPLPKSVSKIILLKPYSITLSRNPRDDTTPHTRTFNFTKI